MGRARRVIGGALLPKPLAIRDGLDDLLISPRGDLRLAQNAEVDPAISGRHPSELTRLLVLAPSAKAFA